jgi:RNA polymerase subunit RPABC4/transcription elongation factor Spt4
MSGSEQSSGFKYVFWGILFLAFLALMGQVMWMTLGGFGSFHHLLGLSSHGPGILVSPAGFPSLIVMAVPTVILFLVWVGVVGSIVYRDAKRRGMDPYMWATVAVFVPFFVGIIIYLVVRSNGRTICDKCGAAIRSEYKVCPLCGHRREHSCPGCSKTIAEDWKVCPHCEHRLVAGT